MLDFTNASLASQEPPVDTEAQPFSFGYDDDATLKGFSSRSSAASVSHSVSLPEISVRSHTLRGMKGIGSGHATPVWPSLFNASSPNYSTPVMHTTNLPGYEADEPFDEAERENTPVSAQTSRIIKKLQQDVLLLQTELQTELWLKRENMRHVSRLHQDHVVTRKAELERQQLVNRLDILPSIHILTIIQHNRLRDYRSRVRELKDQLNQATSMTQKRAEWSTQLQSRLTSLREEKKELGKQVTDLQKANQDLTVSSSHQGILRRTNGFFEGTPKSTGQPTSRGSEGSVRFEDQNQDGRVQGPAPEGLRSTNRTINGDASDVVGGVRLPVSR